MAVLKYKNPNYVVGGTEEKYLPLFNVIVGSSEIYIGEEEPTNGCLIWINPIDNITKYKYNDTWIVLINLQETVTISLVSNQDESSVPNADLLGKSVHVIYGDQDKELVWNGDTMQTTVPMEMSYQVVFPEDARYKCPAQQKYIALAGETREVKGLYYTEVVKVTVSSNDSSDVTGQQVTINGTQYTWTGTTIEVKIPYDVEYSVSVSAKADYKTPPTVTTTASQKINEISMQYTLYKVNTITIDQTINDPATMISGDVNGEIIQWIRNNSHRVLAKQTSDGILTYCRLDDANSNNYYNGSAAVLTGSEGDVFMKMPEFWYKGTEGDNIEMVFSKSNPGGDFVRWDPNTLIGVYKSYCTNSKMYSRSGVSPTAFTYDNCISWATARGNGYRCVDWQMHCIMAALFYAYYGNTNSQAIVGSGTNSHTKNSGQTDSLGMTDTIASTNGNSQSINFWGLENWWGDKYEVLYDAFAHTGDFVLSVDDPVNGGYRHFTIDDGGYTDNYILKMRMGKYLDMYPLGTEERYDSTKGYCDYGYRAQKGNDGISTDAVALRSGYDNSPESGISFIQLVQPSMITTNANVMGSRLAFRGTCIEEPNVEKFKAITITN